MIMMVMLLTLPSAAATDGAVDVVAVGAAEVAAGVADYVAVDG